MIKVTLSSIPYGMVFETTEVTATLTTDGADLRSVQYQWLADGEVIATTNDNRFTPLDAQVGKAITVNVLYNDPAGTAHQVAGTDALTVLDVENRPAGGIHVQTDPNNPNLLHVFDVLRDDDGMGPVSYQWVVAGQPVAGATGKDFTLAPDQVDKHVSIVASWVDLRGHAESVSSDDLLYLNFDKVGTAAVDGKYAPGQTLHASVTDADGLGKVYYAWETSADGKTWTPLAGATTPDLTLGSTVPDLLRSTMVYADNRGNVETHRIVFGGDGDDFVETGAGYTISTGGGNDTIDYYGGTGTVDGGPGLDTFTGPGMYITHTPGDGVGTTDVRTEGAYGAHLVNVERVVLGNHGYAYDIDGAAGEAYRLYQAAFDRAPEEFGVGFWISRLDLGVRLTDVAAAFVGSDEFRTLYGAAPANADLVNKFYDNILHRAPDATGQAFWTGVLDRHEATVADVLVEFSESAENKAALVGVLQDGVKYLPYTGA